jgi:hypothetical chaperone protein
MQAKHDAAVLGLDFGTTNTVAALATGSNAPTLIDFAGPEATASVFRSALCFWEDEAASFGVSNEAGPFAIAEYLAWPQGSRFVQSFKTVAASESFEHASIFEKRYRFEDFGRLFLNRLVAHANSSLDAKPDRIVVGRPVVFAGSRPNPVLARERYDRMFEGQGAEIHYIYEPLGAAFTYATRLQSAATILVADFGGGTSDFSIVHVGEPGAAHRCTPLGQSGIGIAGDHFDYRIVDQLVLPILGKGSGYKSFGKTLDIPGSYFADFANWSRLALMRNRRTLTELARLQRDALDPAAIGRLIAVIDNELGYPLYTAVGDLKRRLSSQQQARFQFSGAGVEIDVEVSRADFEGWIATDLAAIETSVDAALASAGIAAAGIDRVFLTGGSSLIPAIRDIFLNRFGADRVATGGELVSIANGLALIGQQDNIGQWSL